MGLELSGKRALVTGSSAGIGEAIAKTLAAEGAEVVMQGVAPGGALALRARLPDARAKSSTVADGASEPRFSLSARLSLIRPPVDRTTQEADRALGEGRKPEIQRSQCVGGASRCRLALLAVLVAALMAWADTASGARFVVGGSPLFLDCTGRGRPTVILESGLGADHRSWAEVQRRVQRLTRVCSWDRPGLGFSPPDVGGLPSEPLRTVMLLAGLLRAGAIDGRLILVGHSTGAIEARLFQQRYERAVVGLVSVDGTPPSELIAGPPTISFATESLRVPAARILRPLARSLGALPLIVLERGRDLDVGWERAQATLSRQSSDVALIQALHSDHDVPARQPALIAAAIRLAIAANRSGQPITDCQAIARPVAGRCLPAGAVPAIRSRSVPVGVGIIAAVVLLVGLVLATTHHRRCTPETT